MSLPACLRPALAALALSLTVAAPAFACATPGNLDDLRAEAVRAINAQRRAAGLAPVRANPQLTRAAQGHACDSANRNQMGHVGSDGARLGTRLKRAGYFYRIANENVGYGFRSPDSAIMWWMNSPHHRDNILTAGIRDVGIGLAYGPNNTPHWVMDSGKHK